MTDITIELEQSQETINIIEALQNVKCGQDVYNALTAVPTPNLAEMLEMIANIIKHRVNYN